MSNKLLRSDSQWSNLSSIPASSSSDMDSPYLSQPSSQTSHDFHTPSTSYPSSEACGRGEPFDFQPDASFQMSYPQPSSQMSYDYSFQDTSQPNSDFSGRYESVAYQSIESLQRFYSQPQSEAYSPNASWMNQMISQGPPSIALNGIPTNDGADDSYELTPLPLRPPAVFDSSQSEDVLSGMNLGSLTPSPYGQATTHLQPTSYGGNRSGPWSPVNLRSGPELQSYDEPSNLNFPNNNTSYGDDLGSAFGGSDNWSSSDLSFWQPTISETIETFVPGPCLVEGCKSSTIYDNLRAYSGHFKRVHVREFFCKVEGCTYRNAFAKMGDLNRHYVSIHSGVKNFICSRPTCTKKIKAWSRKDKLKEHNRKYHENEKCLICSQTSGTERWYDTWQELEEHTNRSHNSS